MLLWDLNTGWRASWHREVKRTVIWLSRWLRVFDMETWPSEFDLWNPCSDRRKVVSWSPHEHAHTLTHIHNVWKKSSVLTVKLQMSNRPPGEMQRTQGAQLRQCIWTSLAFVWHLIIVAFNTSILVWHLGENVNKRKSFQDWPLGHLTFGDEERIQRLGEWWMEGETRRAGVCRHRLWVQFMGVFIFCSFRFRGLWNPFPVS